MKLEAYLDQEKITLKDFARKVGCSLNYLWMVKKGDRKAGPHLAMCIVEASKGAIEMEDLRPVQKYERCQACGRVKPCKGE